MTWHTKGTTGYNHAFSAYVDGVVAQVLDPGQDRQILTGLAKTVQRAAPVPELEGELRDEQGDPITIHQLFYGLISPAVSRVLAKRKTIEGEKLITARVRGHFAQFVIERDDPQPHPRLFRG